MSRRKFSQSFKTTSRELRQRLFTFLTIVTRWSRSTTVQFLRSDWSKFDRGVHAENLYSIVKLVYFDSWSWEFFVNLWCFLLLVMLFTFYFSTGCIKWNTAAINSLLLFMAGLFIEFLVGKCAACQSWKSDFGWHRFRFFTLLDAGWKVPEAILALLDSFQELHLKWQAWVIIVYSVCFFLKFYLYLVS